MAKVLSTSSSDVWKRRALGALAFVILFIALDRLAYLALFPRYDKVMQLSTVEKQHDALIVGSSHVVWDLDHKWVGQNNQIEIGMASVPGADFDLRRHIIRDFLANRDQRRGENFWIILEADKYSFDPARYPPTAPNVLLGYYHHGLLRKYLWPRLSTNERLRYGFLHAHSLNPQFVFVGASLYDRGETVLSNLFGPVTKLFESPSSEPAPMPLPEWMQGNADARPQTDANPAAAAERQLKVWRDQYRDFGVTVQPEAIQAFEDLVAAVHEDPRARLILLDTPNLLLFPEWEARFDREVRSHFINAAQASPQVYFWRFDPQKFEQDAALFADASHLNIPGRIAYTQEFARRLAEVMQAQ